MTSFDYEPRTRIVFGPGRLDSLGELARELGATRVLVVSDPGVVRAGHTDRALSNLGRDGLVAECFDQVHENPSTRDVEAATRFAAELRPDLLIGLGGGSSMDCAKGVNFLLSNGGRMQDYWGVGKAEHAMLPMIAVPTTAGTGSEAQSFALISDADSHVKMACGDKKAACRIALLDPELTVTQPPSVTALTGVDALAHALETFVTKRRNVMSLTFSREAWRLLSTNFPRVLANPTDVAARGAMQLGACLAGMAIENSMLGAARALANPLTAHYGVIHGQAVGIMLPHVIRYNGVEFDGWYRELMEATRGEEGAPAPEEGSEGLAVFVAGLVRQAGLRDTLADCGVDRERLSQLAEDAARQWTGTFNPRPLDAAEFETVYEGAFC